eukprot:2088715-Amphidinium_carterae.1
MPWRCPSCTCCERLKLRGWKRCDNFYRSSQLWPQTRKSKSVVKVKEAELLELACAVPERSLYQSHSLPESTLPTESLSLGGKGVCFRRSWFPSHCFCFLPFSEAKERSTKNSQKWETDAFQ